MQKYESVEPAKELTNLILPNLGYNSAVLKKVGKTVKIALLGPYLGENRASIGHTHKLSSSKAFHNVDVKKQVILFNKTVLNIIRNFIPHETVTFDDRDPPWITSCIKKIINNKNLAFKHFVNKKGFVNNTSNLERFSSLPNKLSSIIETSKQEYFSKTAEKLSDPIINSKTYWSNLKSFFNR